MNKSTMITIVAVLVLVVGGGLFFANQKSQEAEQARIEQEKATMMQKEEGASEENETPEQEALEKKEGEAMMKKDGDKISQSSASRYVEYSKTILDQSADKRRVL